ncbi:hypothetical protein FZO89_06555 [Luteimonas viscosa]|uniref:Uncharacterized protein n=1 Tax=Luteimonas viscosa TaxID=1132694 RepID=A0A5D4XT58_9GAMM|nr:hypothetical protein [Luteimonas viscosa]TYT25940.1 hypothetical protein FZO89_06555 [Luteimonas viscosa]
MSRRRVVTNPAPASRADEDFSLVLGGPLYQLFIRTRLIRPPLQLLHRRMLFIPALAWLPLLALATLEGNALAGSGLPFLHDIEAYARFLVAMPLLILAEPVVHSWTRDIVHQFDERGVVPHRSTPGLQAAVESATRWRNSISVEVALIASVFVLAPWMWRHMTLYADTWYASVDGGRIQLTRAGWWLVHVSVPVFQFLLLRWWFRLAIWWRFLWQVSRLPLEVRAVHPDRSGGLGFLGEGVYGFMPLLFAQAAVVSGLVASRVLIGARTAAEFRGEIAMLVVLLVAQVLVPMLFFVPRLVAARREGLRRYGALAAAHGREFESKWIRAPAPAGDRLLGNADVSSLSDLASSHDVVRAMRPVPFDLRVLLQLVAISAAPFLPLVLTEIPLAELLRRVVGMVL